MLFEKINNIKKMKSNNNGRIFEKRKNYQNIIFKDKRNRSIR